MNESRRAEALAAAADPSRSDEGAEEELSPERIGAIVREREAAAERVTAYRILRAEGVELSTEVNPRTGESQVTEERASREAVERAEASTSRRIEAGEGGTLGRYQGRPTGRYMTTADLGGIVSQAVEAVAGSVANRDLPPLTREERDDLRQEISLAVCERGAGTGELARRWLHAPAGTEQAERRLRIIEADVERVWRGALPLWSRVKPNGEEHPREAWSRWAVGNIGRTFIRARAEQAGIIRDQRERAKAADDERPIQPGSPITREQAEAVAADARESIGATKEECSAILGSLGVTPRMRAERSGRKPERESEAAKNGRKLLRARWASPSEAAAELLPPTDPDAGLRSDRIGQAAAEALSAAWLYGPCEAAERTEARIDTLTEALPEPGMSELAAERPSRDTALQAASRLRLTLRALVRAGLISPDTRLSEPGEPPSEPTRAWSTLTVPELRCKPSRTRPKGFRGTLSTLSLGGSKNPESHTPKAREARRERVRVEHANQRAVIDTAEHRAKRERRARVRAALGSSRLSAEWREDVGLAAESAEPTRSPA